MDKAQKAQGVKCEKNIPENNHCILMIIFVESTA